MLATTYFEFEGAIDEVVQAEVTLVVLELNPVGPAVAEKLEVRLGTNQLMPEDDGAVDPAVLL